MILAKHNAHMKNNRHIKIVSFGNPFCHSNCAGNPIHKVHDHTQSNSIHTMDIEKITFKSTVSTSITLG